MRKIKLGDLTKITSGGTPNRNRVEYYDNGEIPWIKTGDLKERYIRSSSEFITQLGLEKSSAKIFPPNTMLVAMYGATIGSCSILSFEAATNQACAAILPCDKVWTLYLYYYFLSSQTKLVSLGVGGAQPNISISIIKNLEIPLPPLATQKHIADILDAADALRRKTQQIVDSYDELAQSLFLEMFGDPVRNEKGWDIGKFKDLANLDKKQVLPSEFTKEDFYIGLEDIEKETGNIIKTSSENAADLKSSKFRFTPNHILYAKLRPYLNKVALPYQAGICSTDIFPVLPMEGKSNKFFICYLMRSKTFVTEMHSKSSGANLPRANASLIENFTTYHPPLDLQNQFAEKIALIEQQKELAKQSLTESENLFNALMQKAFKGELVPEPQPAEQAV